MSTGRLPHTTSPSGNQLRRRYNELVDQVSNTVGSISSGIGDIGQLNTDITNIENSLTWITNTNGSYRTGMDGFIEAFGSVIVPASGTNKNSVTITFPNTPTYTNPPNIQVTSIGYPDGSTNDPVSCYAVNVTTTGATIILACSVPTGGGGSNFTANVTVNWSTIGN